MRILYHPPKIQQIPIVNFGLLYNHYAVADARGILPVGWHIPSLAEIDTILVGWLAENGYGYEGSGTDVAKALASTSLWAASATPGTPGYDLAANNATGFNAKPSGIRTEYGLFSQLFSGWTVWTITIASGNAYRRTISSSTATVAGNRWNRRCGVAVRGVKDTTTLSHGETSTMIGNDGFVYPTICIGTQEWMATNYRSTKYRNGDNIPEVTTNADWTALTTGALCAYNNDLNNI